MTGAKKLGLGETGFIPPLQENPVQLCALIAHLQEQDPDVPVIEIDPYELPGDLCEGHLFQIAAFAETLGVSSCECTVANVLAVITADEKTLKMTQQSAA